MKLKQSVNLLLIALFVWAFQGTTIHIHHHVIEDISECNVCDISEKMKLYQNNSPMVMVNENLAVKIRREVQKQVFVAERFDYTQAPKPEHIGTVIHCQCDMAVIPLGFDSTAPPISFS